MTWTTRMAETALAAAVGAVLAGGALVVADTPGRILVAGAAMLLLGQTVRDLMLRPRLAAGPEGVHVRRLGGALLLPWNRLDVRVREFRRLGLRSVTLELDTVAGPDDDGLLVVLSRRDLGTDPAEVARRLRELNPTSG